MFYLFVAILMDTLDAIQDNSIKLFEYNIEKLRKLISDDRLEDFFKILGSGRLRALIVADVTKLHNRYSKVQGEREKGVINGEEYILRYSRLVDSCSSLVDKVERSSFKGN